MKTDTKMVMTVRINKQVADSFIQFMEEMGLRRDTYLNMLLPNEAELLSKVPANSERAAKFARLSTQWLEDQKTRLGIKLDTSLVDRINEVCRDKGIARDQFIETFLDFLVNGLKSESDNSHEEINPPLAKAYELITNPYWEANGELNIYEGLHYNDSIIESSLIVRLLDKSTQQSTDSQDTRQGGK